MNKVGKKSILTGKKVKNNENTYIKQEKVFALKSLIYIYTQRLGQDDDRG